MLKHLTLTFCAIALLPACVIGGGSTDSDSNSNSNSDSNADTTGNGTTEAPTTANPTTGTTGTTGQTTTGTTAEEPTTGQTTTGTTGDAPTTGQTSTTDTTSEQTSGTSGTDTDTDTDTGGGLYGNCGWAAIGYYACAPDGEPGVEDPMMTDPIACPDGIAKGDTCDDEMGPVGSVGCCTPEGVLFYCDTEGQTGLFEQVCN